MNYVCCICGNAFTGWGNDPYPVNTDENAKCCDGCDAEFVLPARLAELANAEKKRKEEEFLEERRKLANKKKLRVNMLRSMNTICESLNDEDIFYAWLINGIADGDCYSMDDDALFDYYGDDETFADVMACFCRIMNMMVNDYDFSDEDMKKGNNLLYCDGVASKMREFGGV